MKTWERSSIAALMAAVAALLLAGSFWVLYLTSPSDGARIRPSSTAWRGTGVLIEQVRAAETPLLDGDEVVAIDGISIRRLAGPILSPGDSLLAWRSGGSVTYTVVRDGVLQDVPVSLTDRNPAENLPRIWGIIVATIAFFGIALFVFCKRPGDPAARALLIASSGVLVSAPSTTQQVGDIVQRNPFLVYQLLLLGVFPLIWIGGLHFVLMFPRPQPLVKRHPGIVRLVYVVPFVMLVSYLALFSSSSNAMDVMPAALGGMTLMQAIYSVLIFAALVAGFRAHRDRVSRQQIRLVATSIIVSSTLAFGLGALPEIIYGQSILGINGQAVVGIIVPVSLAIAILRYRLWDIDIIVNRTIVYGLLTVGVIGTYVVIVGYLGQLIHDDSTLLASLVATGIIAIGFQPVRERLQRLVNRWMYGERDDPYGVLSRLGHQLETVLAPDAVLPTIVQTVAHTLKLPHVAIALRQGDEFAVAATTGNPIGTPLTLPLVYQSETVGRLEMSPRAPGEDFSATDRRVLEGIALQAGIAAHAVQLTADLQRSRERLVTAREEERRRIRRDLHDGLGPALASLMLHLDAARNNLAQDPVTTDHLLLGLKEQLQAAIVDIRRLVYDLRPPALDELGLVGALRAQVATVGASRDIRVMLNVEDVPDSLPAAVEVAAYRIIMEALANTVRHANARICLIRIRGDSALHIDVIDDGQGISPTSTSGIGMRSMRERAEELGGELLVRNRLEGGTQVLATIPLADRNDHG